MVKAAAPLVCKLLMIYPKARAKTGSVIATVIRPGEAERPHLVGTFAERDLHEMRPMIYLHDPGAWTAG
jgi:hypothetical protein